MRLLSPGLRQFLADWPADFGRRIAAGERVKSVDATISLVAVSAKALEIFFGSVDEQGLDATLRQLLDRRFSCEYRYDWNYLDSRWDVVPAVDEALFGTGRTLLPWLAQRHRDGDFCADLWLCEIAPATPQLAENILTRVIDCEEFWERLGCEADYPRNYRKYYPFSLARCAEYALRFVRPQGDVPWEVLPSGGRSIFYLAARSIIRGMPGGGGLFATLGELLRSPDLSVRRRAMLAIYYYPELGKRGLAQTLGHIESDDPYVVAGCGMARYRPGHLSQLATPTELHF